MPADLIRLAEVMRAVQVDCQDDARLLDGMPLTGLVVGQRFGATLAMLSAVAKAVEALCEERVPAEVEA